MTAKQTHGLGNDATGGLTPEAFLVRAIQSGSVRKARVALDHGANVNDRPSDKSFLRLAGDAGCRDICELLVQHAADPNEVSGKRQYSLLHNAVASSNYGFASTLLKLGANPNARTSSGSTPLHFAARSGQGYIARELIKRGASLDEVDRSGRTPFSLAIKNGHDHLAELLRPQQGREVPRSVDGNSWTR